jgi:hypothetical protein
MLDLGAESPNGACGVEHVIAFEQSADPRLAAREAAENQRPVRDGLIAWNLDFAVQALGP